MDRDNSIARRNCALTWLTATGVEGIFRLSGSEKRIKELKQAFNSPDRYGKGLVWDGYTVHDAANVLRRYLNDLPEPVVPLELYEKFREPLRGATKQTAGDVEGPQFVENFDMNAAIAKYQHLITELPPLNRQLLLYILDLLAVFAAKSNENRMTSQNLAAIFQPGLLSHPKHDMAPEEYRLSQAVIIFLIENQDHFLIGMQGTGADEKTVREIQSAATTPARGPVTPIPNRRSSMKRTLSNSSVGAESVAKEGTIRRNKSTSSRHSRTSNGAHSPASPALGSTTPTGGGLARSNTVPSKKSPALRSGRFANRHDPSHSPLTPLTPVTPSAVAGAREHPPAVVEEVPTPPEEAHASQASDPQRMQQTQQPQQTLVTGTPSMVRAGRSQERLLEPRAAGNMTPSRERQIHNLFSRSSPADTEKPPRNKLRKKKLPDSSNPSAQSSTTSLPRSGNASPAIEVSNPLDSHPLTTSPLATVPQGGELGSQLQPIDTPSEPTPRVSQVPSSNTLHPDSATDHTLRTKTSPPTSLHSSFNEASDVEQHDGLQGPLSTESLGIEAKEGEVERKRRWRLSRRKEDIPPGSNPSSPQKRVGANIHADMSTSSVASSSAVEKPRKSFTGDSNPTIASQDQPSSSDLGSREGRDETNRGLTGWIKNKYRDAKDHVDNRRNKSPPADRFSTLGETMLPSRGKSMDVPRPAEENATGPGQTEQSTRTAQ